MEGVERGPVYWYRGVEVYSCEFSKAKLRDQQAKLRDQQAKLQSLNTRATFHNQ
jgi:hypothetical protein